MSIPAPTILVADDDAVTLALLTAALHHAGYQVHTVMDAMQVVMEAHRHLPDAIILDILMPGGGGLVALQRLRGATSTALVPIIAISGSTDPTLPARTRAEGANAFLPKPVAAADLRDLLIDLLGPTNAPAGD